MKSRFFLVLGLCLAIATTGFSQIGAASSKKAINLNEEIKLDGKVRYGKLANGLTYYIKSNKKPENRAEFQIAVNAGSVLEAPDQVGLAHFSEHMGFNGTKQFPGNSLIDNLEKEGIVFGREINAYTGFDQTVYMVTLPTDKKELFDMGLKILDGWAFGMLMTETEINKERGVIIEEWRMGQGAQDRLRAKTWPTMLKGSLYAERLPIGTLENLQNFKPESIRRFYKTWYRPENMAIIVVGDFDADEMETKVKDYFQMNDAPSTPFNRPTITLPSNKEPLIAIATDKEATSNSIQFFYKHPSKQIKTIGDFREQSLVYGLFEQMINSRLQELTDKKDCPFMYAGVGYGNFLARPTDAYMAFLSAKEGKTMQAMEAVLTENQRVLQHGFVQTELDRAKESLLIAYDKAAKEESKTESSRLAAGYVDNFLEGTPQPGARIENKYAKELMDDIKLEELNALVGKWITDENFVVNITMPEKAGIKAPTEKDVLKLVEKVKNSKTKPYVDNVKTEPFLAKEPKAGKVKSRVDNKEFGFTELVLSNGATVILKPTTFKNDEIILNAWSAGGSSLYPDNKMINAQYAPQIIDGSGIGNYDNSQLQKFLKGKTVGIMPSIGDLEEGFTGSSSPKDFETLLQYLYMYFEVPRKDKNILDKEISNLNTQIQMVKNMPEFEFQIQMFKSMYPNDKRTILLPTEDQVKKMNIDEMYQIFRERFSDASDFTFTFVGNFGIDTTIALIEKYIGGMPSKGKKEQWLDKSTQFVKGSIDKTVYKGEADKGMLVLATNKPFDWNEKETMTTRVLGDILDIKLTETIREELGGTYSPMFRLEYDKYPKSEITVLAMYSCDPQNIDKLTSATWGVFDKIMSEGPSDLDLAKVKEQLIRARETQYKEKNNFWGSFIKGSRWYGNTLKTIEQYNAAVNAVTKEDVQAMAKKYLDHKDNVRVSLKPAAMQPAK
ncbi:MAG: insulinase family protein [Bacteroidales bacterium]